MVNVTPDMMFVRRSALEESLGCRNVAPHRFTLDDMRVDINDHCTTDEDADTIPARLTQEICNRLVRDENNSAPGVAIVGGLAARFGLAQARFYHEILFNAVWQEFSRRSADIERGTDFKVKTGVVADGAIPAELYGSSWSFKQLHIDREALLFSHLYGPTRGFTGGDIILVDALDYMARNQLGFDDTFEWSVEPTPGSKPVLQRAHQEAAVAESGIRLASIDYDKIIFVNNAPSAGILHGASLVEITDQQSFAREYHRCSVKALPADGSILR